jgi:hypothetical protein
MPSNPRGQSIVANPCGLSGRSCRATFLPQATSRWEPTIS